MMASNINKENDNVREISSPKLKTTGALALGTCSWKQHLPTTGPANLDYGRGLVRA